MSRDEVQFEPLDVNNYAEWMAQMKYLLIGKDLWDIVKNGGGDTEEKKKKEQKSLAAIGLRVKKHHLNTVEQAGIAKGLWDTCTATYKAKNNARKISLRKELNTLIRSLQNPLPSMSPEPRLSGAT